MGGLVRTILAVFIGVGMPAAADERPNPSFSCDKAKALDEIAICSDARLAELDRLRAEDFRKALAADPKEARESAKSRLEARSACANDRVCILDMLRYSGNSPEPKWVEGYRAKLVRDVLPSAYTRTGGAKGGLSPAAVGRARINPSASFDSCPVPLKIIFESSSSLRRWACWRFPLQPAPLGARSSAGGR
jgi:hypothetical protein